MSASRVKDGGLRRHLEGWPGALIALGIGGLGVVLGTPRAVTPTELPQPLPDGRALQASRERDAALAAELSRASEQAKSGPGFALRELGSLLRRYGEADAADDKQTLSALRIDLVPRTAGLLREPGGEEALLRLRAFQQQVFLRELRSWESTGVETAELRQVGGGFLITARGSGWVRDGKLLADVHARSALFQRRFADVLGVQGRQAFVLSLDDARALYAFFFLHPPREGSEGWQWRLRKVDELSSFDASYPRELARGVAMLQLGQGAPAVVELKEHLGKNPDGPYTLRARNYLVAALELAEAQGGALP